MEARRLLVEMDEGTRVAVTTSTPSPRALGVAKRSRSPTKKTPRETEELITSREHGADLERGLQTNGKEGASNGNGNGQQRKKRQSTAVSRSGVDPRPSLATVREKISVFAVVVHLLKGNIGPGAMSLPNGFSKTGIYAAPFYFVIVALVSTYNMDLLLYCKRVVCPTRNASFGDVAGKILGRRGKLLIDIFLVGTQLGICCVYFTFVATNLHVVLPEKLQSVVHERQLILVIFPLILMLSWIRTLSRITPFSGLANIAVFLGITIVFYYSIDYYQHPTEARQTPVHVDVSQFPEFYGTAVYSFEGIGLILPIQNEMQNPHMFPRVLALCMLTILVLFLFIGEVPTIAFGRISNGSMTAVLHEYCEGWLVTAANVLLAFACLLSFPIQFYPAVDVLESALNKRGALTQQNEEHQTLRESIRFAEASENRRRASATSAGMAKSIERSGGNAPQPRPSLARSPVPPPPPSLPWWMESLFCTMSQYECNRTLFRSMLCTSLMIIAVCIPDVGLLISLFGAVGSSMLAIIIPPVLYVKLHQNSLPLLSLVMHYGIIVFGVLGMIAGTIQAVGDVVASFTGPEA